MPASTGLEDHALQRAQSRTGFYLQSLAPLETCNVYSPASAQTLLPPDNWNAVNWSLPGNMFRGYHRSVVMDRCTGRLPNPTTERNQYFPTCGKHRKQFIAIVVVVVSCCMRGNEPPHDSLMGRRQRQVPCLAKVVKPVFFRLIKPRSRY